MKDGERTLARVEAFFDETLIAREYFAGAEQAEGESEFLLGAEAVREEVTRLNEDWQNWVYVVPSYRADYMSVRKEDMIKEPEKTEKSAGDNKETS